MAMQTTAPTKIPAPVTVAAADLNGHGGVFCPSPLAHMQLWSAHPKVYLDLSKTGSARCPYCGTVYQLQGGAAALAHGH